MNARHMEDRTQRKGTFLGILVGLGPALVALVMVVLTIGFLAQFFRLTP